MLVWIDPKLMNMGELRALAVSGRRAPVEEQRWSDKDIAERVLSGCWMVFRCPGGLFAVEKIGSRLYVQALNIKRFGWRMRSFRNWLDRLATDLMCDTVQTVCFDERLARAMVKIEAKAEAWQMVWQVKGRQHG